MSSKKRIAILGWGSLIWDKDELFDKWHDEWQLNGPILPIEFSRISSSRSKALTLVVDSVNGADVKTYFSLSKRNDSDDAFCDLRCREKTSNSNIGIIDLATKKENSRDKKVLRIIKGWAEKMKFDIVIWTDLPSNFKNKFSSASALEHLKKLSSSGKTEAIQYIQKAPIETPFKRFLFKDAWYKEQCEKMKNKLGNN